MFKGSGNHVTSMLILKLLLLPFYRDPSCFLIQCINKKELLQQLFNEYEMNLLITSNLIVSKTWLFKSEQGCEREGKTRKSICH